MSECVLIYIPTPSREEALRISRCLLEKKLIACVNILPIESMYWWEGAIQEAAEVVILAKTLPERYNDVRHEVENIHPYSVPCITSISAHANDSFFEWLKDQVTGE